MGSRCIFKNLTVGCWNIEGADEKVNSTKISKLDQPFFKDTLKTFDILCVQETHLSQDDNIPQIHGYDATPHCRKISGNNRYFGGMLVYIKTSIKKGVKIGHNFDVDTLEVKLLKNFFGLNKDIKFLFTYASPINSSYTKSRNMNILEKIEVYYIDGEDNTIIMGDLNGKTKQGEDFVRDSLDRHSPINTAFYDKDEYLNRENKDDHVIDEQGKLILELCKNSKLRILNGRTAGDQRGEFTRYPTRNIEDKPSVIDYAICSEPLRTEVISFTVLPFTGLSDHSCISLKIKTKTEAQEPTPTPIVPPTPRIRKYKDTKDKPKSNNRYIYDKEKKHVYENALRDDTNINLLKSMVNRTDISIEEIDNAITQINDILLNAAKKSRLIIRQNPLRNNKVKRKHEWFTKECKNRRNILRKYSKDLSTNPFDKTKRKSFLEARATYKKVCRKAEKECRQLLTQKLMKIGLNNPKTFWNVIKKMNNWGKTQVDPADNIPCETWVKHFESLLNNDKMQNTPENSNEANTFDPLLDGIISAEELRDALRTLKIAKAPGPDQILGEYLKIFGAMFEPIILKLVREMFSRHIYPTKWTTNFLKPIYKKGQVSNPNNFRGLAIGPAFGKLYSIILLNRLMKYIGKNKLISPQQIGFMKNSGTSDHIFLLQTIIEKVVKKDKNKLYTAFIDFKKAYDTVNRNIMIKRLKKLGINGIFLKNIVAMYNKTDYIVKLNSGCSRSINSNLGLKQGCPLSPMLFNLYIDDTGEAFNESCCPIEFQNEPLSHFLYADDLVIISLSKEGLQNSLNNLHKFSLAKDLTISVTKSKCMIFNQAGRHLKTEFTINNEPLENVNSFCYLGFDVKCSGTVKHAMNILHDKAKKALRPLITAIARFNLPVQTSIRLFNTFISPILLYNAENWSTLTDKKLQQFTNNTIFDDISDSKTDLVHRKLLKFVLGVSKSCPNLAVYGETSEIPLSLKAYRLTLNFWHRVTNLPDSALAKKAMLENIRIRTNWICTIEKLINCFNLADKIGNHIKFKKTTKYEIEKSYVKYWKRELEKPDIARLLFYKEIKDNFKKEKYLEIENSEHRRTIAKLRCSDHPLEIETGRHRKIDRNERLCKQCTAGAIENECHFLIECNKYDILRTKHNIAQFRSSQQIMNELDPVKLGIYLTAAFSIRESSKTREMIPGIMP